MASQVIRMTVNPQKIYIPTTNEDHTIIFDDVMIGDDYMGTIKIDNISAAVRFNANGAIDANYSASYTTTDTPLFDAKKGVPLHYYGASGTAFQVTVFNQ